MSEAFDPRVTPWHIDDSEFYEIESFGDQMRFLVRFAILAPSSHNSQPWEFRVTSEGVEVFADRGRGLPAIDPDERELLMSVGAAITNFRVAAAHFGFDTTVLYESRLEESLPLALISVCETCAPRSDLAQLFNAIRKRHTNREPFDGKPISPQVSSRIRELVDAFPETFRIVFPYEKRRAGELVARADHLQMSQAGLPGRARRVDPADPRRAVRRHRRRPTRFPVDSLGCGRMGDAPLQRRPMAGPP
jgi:hypothetical protein